MNDFVYKIFCISFFNVLMFTFLDMTEEEGYEVLKKCVREVQKRLLVNLPNFKVQKVSKDGITDLPPIMAKNLAIEDVANE